MSVHNREMMTLYAIAQKLAQRSGQKEMLQQTLDILESRLGMLRGTIMLVTADDNELVIEATSATLSEPQQDVRYRRGEGITGLVFESGRPAIIQRISSEPQFRDRIHRRYLAEMREVSFVCVPITLGNEAVGTLSVDLPFREEAKLENEERLLCIVASMIANDVQSRRVARLEHEALENENRRLLDALKEQFRPENIIGNSRGMRDIYTRIHQVAGSDTTALIRGESGTGKELVASAIHFTSARAERPLIKLNCAAMNESLVDSELFGHERGSFTGALYTRVGRIEEAEGGTLFLDEIGDFSPAIQVKLLRVLQEREYERVGGNQTRKANVRIITATNRDLEKAVRDGQFRQDLYYRINVFPLFLPPLRDRKDDILLLANHFVAKYARKMGKAIRRISTPAINMMMTYHWPGNVRELENCIEHAMLVSTDEVIHGYSLPPTLQSPETDDEAAAGTMKMKIQVMERDMIVDALKRSGGNISAASRELGITERMVRYKIKLLGIDYKSLFSRRRSS